mmetsp:Transcript_4656/g.3921  ORF Transcript_4656/g.3921 Transcript_4656/m.3921 type:complete len:87 (+) Transcript_4656:644-904(+)
MLNYEEGSLFNKKGDLRQDLKIRYRKVKEFTFTPNLDFLPSDKNGNPIITNQTHGWYSIDGEKYEIGKVHCHVEKRFLAVMSLESN